MSKGAAVTHHHHPMSEINYQVNIKRMSKGAAVTHHHYHMSDILYVNYQVDFLFSLPKIDADILAIQSLSFWCPNNTLVYNSRKM